MIRKTMRDRQKKIHSQHLFSRNVQKNPSFFQHFGKRAKRKKIQHFLGKLLETKFDFFFLPVTYAFSYSIITERT